MTLHRVPELADLAERVAGLGSWRLDLASGVVAWSVGMARLHGLPPGHVPSHPLAHFAGPWQRQLQPLLQACMAQGEPFDCEAQCVDAAGRLAWVRAVAEPVRDGTGAIVAVQGVVQALGSTAPRSGAGQRVAAALADGQPLVTVDAQGHVSFANPAAQELLGQTEGALLGRRLWSSFQKTVRLSLEERFRQALDLELPLQFEALDARQVRWIEVRGFAFAGGMALQLCDVTPRRTGEEQLRLLEGSISRLNDIVIITDAGPFSEPGPRIVFVNEAFERRTGWSRHEVLGRSPRFLQGPNTQRTALDRIRLAMEAWKPSRVDLVNYRKDGEPYWVDLDVSPVWDRDRKLTHWVAVGRDVTERKLAEEKIQHLAFYDTLTRLPNRALLMDRLHAALTDPGRPRRGALMFIDLDNFKVLNDTQGHQKGDLLLQVVAERLHTCVSKTDTVARLGGDEFVVLLESREDKPLDPVTGARAVAERILAALGEPYVLPGTLHHSTCSIGVALFDGGERTVSELLKQADLAMYQAKSAGRNTVCFFDPGMQAVVSAHAALASDLRQAWREGQFEVDYQPQVAADGRLIGVEALLRWRHPVRGMVAPDQFIGLAEDTALILPIGRWVLDTACAQVAAWSVHPQRRLLSIAVNVSVRQFRHPDFVDQVLQAIEAAGIDPSRLKLELTESLLADGIDVTIAKMAHLKDLGVQLSLDDFGIGYSSLSYLKRLPLDQLKIDREFVKDVLTDANDAAIARTVIHLAHSLSLDVIAEGVETPAQRDFLAQHGCDAYQGYLYCRPLPVQALESWMDRYLAGLQGG